MDSKKLGSLLIRLRKENQLSQKDISQFCNVTVQAVSKWERGESVPDIVLLEKLSNLYHISINDLIKGDNNILSENIQTPNNFLKQLKAFKKYKQKNQVPKELILDKPDIKNILISKLFVYISIVMYLGFSFMSIIYSVLSDMDGYTQDYTSIIFFNLLSICISIFLMKLLKYYGSIYTKKILIITGLATTIIPIILLINSISSVLSVILIITMFLIPIYLFYTAYQI